MWNWLDWTLAGIIFLSALFAIRKGFVRELIALATVVLALVLAALEYPRVAGWFDNLTKSHGVADAAGFLAVFGVVLVAGALISALAGALIHTAGVEWFDRFLGGLFGVVRGVLIDCVVLMILVAFAIKPQATSRSRLAPYISTGARVIAFAMPRGLKDDFHAGFEKFRQAVIGAGQQAAKRDTPL